MFAKIGRGQEIAETLEYNEEKLEAAQAKCLWAGNFAKDVEDLSREDKRYHFTRLISLNENVHKPVLHISLNFHPTDKLSDAQLVQISREYLEKMGFGRQPYLIYRHTDIAHPHTHLITTYIQKDGKAVPVPRSQFYYSQQISREMELRYHLASLGKRDRMQERSGQPLTIQYGKVPTMPALSNVLDKVVGQYKCTSLEELNAVLRLYNVEAYRGREESRLYKYRGLIYRVLDEQGKRTGSQVKASAFDSKPTLARLERQFELHRSEPRRQEYAEHIQAAVDWALAQRQLDPAGLEKSLQKERITMVRMKDKTAGEERLFYVDHQTRSVFDARQLGERYHGKGLDQRCTPKLTPEQQQEQVQKSIQQQRGRDEQSLEL
ncbi:MAG: relaxase/mobilization nuclease domain-containing protein [Chitinophagaceae bacterium]|nr:relaxase/mobilization nuclease domain-containing protein [Chitinophagaceae bacterium]